MITTFAQINFILVFSFIFLIILWFKFKIGVSIPLLDLYIYMIYMVWLNSKTNSSRMILSFALSFPLMYVVNVMHSKRLWQLINITINCYLTVSSFHNKQTMIRIRNNRELVYSGTVFILKSRPRSMAFSTRNSACLRNTTLYQVSYPTTLVVCPGPRSS